MCKRGVPFRELFIQLRVNTLWVFVNLRLSAKKLAQYITQHINIDRLTVARPSYTQLTGYYESCCDELSGVR